MRKFLILLLFLAGCGLNEAQTPQQRYYVLKSAYKEILTTEVIYVQNCYQKPVTDSCYAYSEKIREYDKKVREAFLNADAAGAETNTTVNQEVITAINTALTALNNYMQEINNDTRNN